MLLQAFCRCLYVYLQDNSKKLSTNFDECLKGRDVTSNKLVAFGDLLHNVDTLIFNLNSEATDKFLMRL